MILAMVGAVLGIIRGAAHLHLARVLGSLTAALLAPVWWHLASAGTAGPSAWYVASLVVAASGLLLGVHVVESRYGVREVEKLGGLAGPMPRFAILMGLLFMAAMGLPLFGVFSGFMTMLVTSSPRAPLGFVLLLWFVASLLLLRVWHRLFYGSPRDDLRYEDVSVAELVPFAILIGLLSVISHVPMTLGPPGNQPTAIATAAQEHR
jgi:NADH-quinone oxidoreductase subunit M